MSKQNVHMNRSCLLCNKLFILRKTVPFQKYCSKKCSSRAWHIKNKDKERHRKDEYRKKHLSWFAAYYKRRRQKHPEYRIRHNMSIMLYQTLNGKCRSAPFMSILGCSLKFFMQYLEKQFQPGMTWSNYGNGINKWNLDHIIPRSKFDHLNPDEIKKCWHYSNIRPMWSSDNSRKRDNNI